MTLLDHPQHADVEGYEAQHLVGETRTGLQGPLRWQGSLRNTSCRIIHWFKPFRAAGIVGVELTQG